MPKLSRQYAPHVEAEDGYAALADLHLGFVIGLAIGYGLGFVIGYGRGFGFA